MVAALVLPTSALGQELANDNATRTNTISPTIVYGNAVAPRFPDYGYVVYDNAGKPAKVFGPNTPVTSENGSINIVGGNIPTNWTVKTEDPATYLKALAVVGGADVSTESDYTQEIREVVDSINEGAKIVKETLCENPARPSVIKVEVAGGFSLGVYGSITSTVDWDLDKICPAKTAAER